MTMRNAAGEGVEGGLNDTVPQLPASEMAPYAVALGLPADAGMAEILAAIGALRAGEMLEQVSRLPLDRVRGLLDLPETASPLDCAAELAGRVPADMATTAIAAMQLVQARETLRHLEVREIMRDALRV